MTEHLKNRLIEEFHSELLANEEFETILIDTAIMVAQRYIEDEEDSIEFAHELYQRVSVA